MKPNDFAYYLTGFLTKYLPNETGASVNTISSYRDTFTLLLEFMRDKKHVAVEKITLVKIKKEIIEEFLDWIEIERNCSTSTRNVRLAALHSFFKYLQYENPDYLLEWQRILSIPIKKCEKGIMTYMTVDGIKLLLEMPDVSTRDGRRDLALISLMYDTGARVQEIVDLIPSCIRFEHPCTIKLTGKGNKARIVPLMEKETHILKRYMEEERLLTPAAGQYPLFFNRRKEKLTRAGIGYILDKYVKMARNMNNALVPEKFTCHCLRHSKAMHLLQAGVNLVYIRDILGHSSVQTTEIYARADSKQKREAIERAYTDVTPIELPIWQTNNNLLEWLKNFNR
ncbi:site-specific integrase [Thermoanaerobacterium sp. CMT5567-10]|uniref:site-specific integrase n=1 Tax=Thermoanaerobacterium sp. CMT5567-10 TaxID=3061989 RepID=UPI0026DEF16C|nr:site-specific integrase [Thermoanaerobacterium sp. CMT5567-10]WKV08583.1 site-specific integrase [Thermoanaerobacterium sp. CMT5567-10]